MIELHYMEERCAPECHACEDEFKRHVGGGRHPGVKALAAAFTFFTPTEWVYIAVPVHSAVNACPHDALMIIERGGN